VSVCSATPSSQLMNPLDLKHYRCNRVGGIKNYSKCAAFSLLIITGLIKPVRHIGRSCESMSPNCPDTILTPLLILVREVIYSFPRPSTKSSISLWPITASEPKMKKVRPCSGFCARTPTVDRPSVVCYRRLYFRDRQV